MYSSIIIHQELIRVEYPPGFDCPTCFDSGVFVNPRRACAARVTVVGSVCPLSHISPMERLFVLKTLSRTQRATKVKKFVGFSLKPLRCRDPALPPLFQRKPHKYFDLRCPLST